VLAGATPRYEVTQSAWVVVSGNQGFWRHPEVAKRILPWDPRKTTTLAWTDDFTSLWRILQF
jgi:hypothetical protein